MFDNLIKDKLNSLESKFVITILYSYIMSSAFNLIVIKKKDLRKEQLKQYVGRQLKGEM